jgi:hypothetical protein
LLDTLEPQADALPRVEVCRLDHRAFTKLGAVAFRRAETDGTPVMVMPLGEREAAVPLRSLQRELAIEDNSADGRMLGLIAEALDFVSGLALGDELPAEVLTGKASWAPAPRHLWLAASRLRMQLLAWLLPGTNAAFDDRASMERLVSDPKMRAQVQRAFEKAARVLGLTQPEDVVTAVDDLAGELAYIEALREGLLGRVQALVRRLTLVQQSRGVDLHRLEMLQQVGRLATIALRQIRQRFDEVDAHTGEVIAALRNAEGQKSFIRSHRDQLYRASRGWESILSDWDLVGTGLDEAFWALMSRSYHFLAPRFMPVTEWRRLGDGEAVSASVRPAAMTW